MKDLLAGIAEVISRYSITSGGRRFGVAVSGGADSVVLLHALRRLSSDLDFHLLVVHINHQLRGAESDADETFVRAEAEKLELDVRVVHAPIDAGSGNLEELARNARRSVFGSLIETGTADWIALGHTLTDQAETVLFRLLRGAGVRGLAGMSPVSPERLFRPLLQFTREEVREWAQAQGIVWREDSSNQDARFRRNFIRNDLFPQIRASLNPAVDTVLARTAEVARSEEEYWNSQIDNYLLEFATESRSGLICDVKYLRNQHLAIQRRLMRRAIEGEKGDLRVIDVAHVDAVLAICSSGEGHDRVQIPGIDALRSYDILRLSGAHREKTEKRHYRVPAVLNSEIVLPFHAGIVYLRETRKDSDCVNVVGETNRSETVNFDSNALGGTAVLRQLVFRNWEPGDAYRPAGHHNRKKIKELFQENRVLLWERRHWPVLDLNGEIVWARGFGAAREFQLEQDHGSAVSLTFVADHESNVSFTTSDI